MGARSIGRREWAHLVVIYAALRNLDMDKQGQGHATSEHFDKAKHAHGGRHAQFVENVHARLKEHSAPQSTVQDRLNAVIDQSCANLQSLKGQSVEEVFDAVQHTFENVDALKAAITHGVA